MAVYTPLTEQQLASFLQQFEVAPLHVFRGASEGVENSTFFLQLQDQQEFVLTLFETLSAAELPFYIELLTFLNQQQLPVPCPLLDKSQQALHTLAGKPALLFPKARGNHIEHPEPATCAKIAALLARLHLACNHFSRKGPNPRGLNWFKETFAFVAANLNSSETDLIREQIDLFDSAAKSTLPKAVIHGDLFRDNVLFLGDDVSAMIDFYNAGNDFLLLDIAITYNDWCIDKHGQIIPANADAFLRSYQSIRPFGSEEETLWQDFLQIAACRFWLSRLKALELSRRGQQQAIKDPSHYQKVLLLHLQNRPK